MPKTFLYCILLFAVIACTGKEGNNVADYNTTPLPQSIVLLPNNPPFILDESTMITYHASASEAVKTSAGLLAGYISENTGYIPTTTSDSLGHKHIILATELQDTNPEAYHISVNDKNIIINGASDKAISRAIQTLRRSIPATGDRTFIFPAAEITDYPLYSHRGASLDVARHFFPTEFVKKYIDLLALSNLNVFHWHLTDDQGWRIEINKYPELTRVGSKRDKTIIGRHTETYRNETHGGYYTQEEIKEVVRYASDRGITVIPEIDIPGHTLAVLASYPHLGCTGDPYKVATGWGIFKDVLCVGNEDSFHFLEDVLEEVAPLFPGPYIHIGGDECLKDRWLACPKCQARVRQLGMKDNPEHTVGEQLQSYFIKRVEKTVNRLGKKIIGWDEILEGGIAPGATIMSWRGTEGGLIAARKGHDVIMTPERYVYLDYFQAPDVDNEPFTFGWLTELSRTWSFDPMPDNLETDKQKHILGAQVNLWSEYMPTEKNVEYMLLPRMTAVAENLWNPGDKDYNDFVSRAYKLSKRWDRMDARNCKWAYGVRDSILTDSANREVRVYLSTFDNAPIYYTLNGDEPDRMAVRYEKDKPITIYTDVTLKAVVIREGEPSDIFSKTFHHHKALACPVTLTYQPDPRYTFAGSSILTDGQQGARTSYRSGTWLGFLGNDMEATIDMKEPTTVSTISLGTYINPRGGLYPPRKVIVSVSSDGQSYREIHNEPLDLPLSEIAPATINISLKQIEEVRFLRVQAESIGTLPPDHDRAGSKAHLMIDEIIVQ